MRIRATRPAVLPALAAALLVLTGPLAGPADARITSPFRVTRTLQLAPGIRHAWGTMRTSAGIQAVQVATIDPADPRVRVRALLSNDRVVGLERPSLNADRRTTPTERAVVATNGDVSLRGATDGDAAPHSLHVSGGEVMVVEACTRPTLGVAPDGSARMDDIRLQVTMDTGRRWGDTWIKRVNTARRKDTLTLYTPAFGPRTLTGDDGSEAVLAVDDILRPSGTVTATVVSVRHGAGDTRLSPGRFVLSGTGDGRSVVDGLVEGQAFHIRTRVLVEAGGRCGPPMVEAPAWWGTVVETLGGNRSVVDEGAVSAPSPAEYPAGAVAAPRTSVGVTADGHVLMVTVDGRQAGYSIGVTLAEMGALMRSLGAVDAANLDGGGSTVMAIRRPGAAHLAVSDRPSDGRERSLTQALAAFSVDP